MEASVSRRFPANLNTPDLVVLAEKLPCNSSAGDLWDRIKLFRSDY